MMPSSYPSDSPSDHPTISVQPSTKPVAAPSDTPYSSPSVKPSPAPTCVPSEKHPLLQRQVLQSLYQFLICHQPQWNHLFHLSQLHLHHLPSLHGATLATMSIYMPYFSTITTINFFTRFSYLFISISIYFHN